MTEQRFEEHQAKWPEAVFNEDAYFKYLQPLVEQNTASYLTMLQGSKAEQRKWWLYNRFRYLDSKYNAGDALTDVVTLRGYAKDDITVTPYADIYATVKYGSYLVQQRANRNVAYTLACPLSNVNDTEIYIYSASQLQSIGDLSGLMVGYADFSMATRLQSLKVGDAKLFLIKLQQDGKGYSTVKTVRGVLRPAFQMAVDDDLIIKNPFGFQLAGVVVNDSVTREAIKPDQMRKFLKFVHDDNVYCKYYEVVFILFHTGMRISEFCGLTIRDLDMENRIINIDHQLQRTGMTIHIESTKTNAGTRKIPMTEDVYRCFLGILEDRETPTVEKIVDGYSGFLFLDKEGLPEVAMHWEHRFNHMVKRYNEIYRVQIPNITPHVCRHTYCSNMARAGMNPKTLQYLMGHSDIGVTMNTYTHLGLEDAQNEMIRLEELNRAKEEVAKAAGEQRPVTQRSFRAV